MKNKLAKPRLFFIIYSWSMLCMYQPIDQQKKKKKRDISKKYLQGETCISDPKGNYFLHKILKTKQKTTSVGENVEKLGHFYTVGGNIKWYRSYKK